MVRRLRTQICAAPGAAGYGCAFCSAHLCLEQDVVSKYFHGMHGKAFLVDRCENAYFGPAEEKSLMTGVHIVRDMYCSNCDHYLGWSYDMAHQEKERYKIHRIVLERKLMRSITADIRHGSLGVREMASPKANLDMEEMGEVAMNVLRKVHIANYGHQTGHGDRGMSPKTSLSASHLMERPIVTQLRSIPIGVHYRLEERLGGGAFGVVFRGRDVRNDTPVAIKMELAQENGRSHLYLEHRIYKTLQECPVTVGVPRSYFCGRVGEYTTLVMDYLGPSLEDLFVSCHHKLGVKTVCMLGVQMIQRIEYLHANGYVHRDIKSENFVMGMHENSAVVYLIDFGLAKQWRDANGQHVPFHEGRSLTGTARYMSINTHRGLQQSRRDDMESVAYLIMYLLRGSLPWQGLKTRGNDTRYEHVCQIKISYSPSMLAEGYPHQFAELVRYARSLKYEEEPNYLYCVELLLQVLDDNDMHCDFAYDWSVDSEKNPRTPGANFSKSGTRTSVPRTTRSVFAPSDLLATSSTPDEDDDDDEEDDDDDAKDDEAGRVAGQPGSSPPRQHQRVRKADVLPVRAKTLSKPSAQEGPPVAEVTQPENKSNMEAAEEGKPSLSPGGTALRLSTTDTQAVNSGTHIESDFENTMTNAEYNYDFTDYL